MSYRSAGERLYLVSWFEGGPPSFALAEFSGVWGCGPPFNPWIFPLPSSSLLHDRNEEQPGWEECRMELFCVGPPPFGGLEG